MLVPPYRNNDIDVVLFESLTHWDYILFHGFQYDGVTDALIEEAFEHPDLMKVDPTIGWEDDIFLLNHSMRDELKHPMRIARIIECLLSGELLYPIEIDMFCVDKCLSCVTDGHHRVRSLQYMGFDAAPFSISGYMDSIDELLAINKILLAERK